MQKLSLGIVLTSQGVAFLHGGSEFCRTKGGNNNSYDAGDAVNSFDWNRKAQFQDVFDYVRGLIALRRMHPAFRMNDAQQVRANLKFIQAAPLVAYALNGAAVGDEWRTIFVAYNGDPTAKKRRAASRPMGYRCRRGESRDRHAARSRRSSRYAGVFHDHRAHQ